MPKVIVIGIDGATFDLIEPWAEQGRLPVLRNLIAEGVHGPLKSCIPPVSCPAWKCFSTGKNPGKLGVFGFHVLKPDSYTPQVVNATYFNNDEIWDLLGREGLKSGVFNMPATYPPKKINSFMICGFLTPGIHSDFTFPPELKDELINKTGFKFRPDNPKGMFFASDAFIRDHHNFLDTQVRTMKYLMQEKEWDFLLLVFRETDTVQHVMWKYMDADHPEYTEEMHEKYGNVIKEYWEKLDAKIGELIDELTEDFTLILMSDHGFGRLEKNFNINDWLIQEGFLVLSSRGGTASTWLSKMRVSREGLRYWVNRLSLGPVVRKLVPRDVIIKTSGKIPKAGGGIELENANIDWEKSRAFAIGGDMHSGMIYLNKKGWPKGFIEIGSEYERLRDEIIDKLREVMDPEMGQKLKMDVYRPEEIYWGERIENSPDIIVLSTASPEIGFDTAVEHSSLLSPPEKHRFTASHRMNGIFIAKGPEIRRAAKIEGVEIVDLAPTILHIMGVPIPEDMDGRVLKEIFKGGSSLDREVQYQEARESTIEELKLTSEEEMVIKDRLRGLGYVG